MSTICLLPPERSHMVSSPLLAQPVVAAGGWAAVDGSSDPWLQAASSSAPRCQQDGPPETAPHPALLRTTVGAYDGMHSNSCRGPRSSPGRVRETRWRRGHG